MGVMVAAAGAAASQSEGQCGCQEGDSNRGQGVMQAPAICAYSYEAGLWLRSASLCRA